MPQLPLSSAMSFPQEIVLASASVPEAGRLSIHLWDHWLLVVELHLKRRKFVFEELELLLMRGAVVEVVDAHH